MKKVRLTKNRLKSLETAISIDDVLYAKFDAMNRRFNEQVRKWQKTNQVIMVVQKLGSKSFKNLQIIKETKTSDGIYVEVV